VVEAMEGRELSREQGSIELARRECPLGPGRHAATVRRGWRRSARAFSEAGFRIFPHDLEAGRE
jgi:hypothetical protein